MTTVCEACGAAIAEGAGSYSKAGALLCTPCDEKARVGDAEAAGAASQRRARALAIAVISFMIVVPAALFAAGLGVIVAHTLVGLGILAIMGGGSALRLAGPRVPLSLNAFDLIGDRKPEPMVLRGAAYVIGCGVLALALGVLLESRY